MFKKILIANRGEIACRIMRTAKRMGIKTVAVYSEADADALHVREADEAVPIGPARSAESYLKIDRLVAACRASGAEAVHPGYGFLSENPAFPRALEANGITFIGPPAPAIEAMGDKITAKKLAAAAGVSIVPGHPEAIADADSAIAIAPGIGYPVIIKAAAGGGGKGMRIAANDAQLREGFRLARSEARSAFGDDRVFLEKYIEEPRHIEIQVLADAHGNFLHLGERECSIQRRHQKIIEEAPSPFLDEKTRAAMGAEAVALAKAAQYRSAGTVEFVVDRERKYYFLEMNTRLQVEHPVTELVTGLDLVELMIRIAAGEKLSLRQRDIRLQGAAIEARVYAEDPRRGFLPSSGRVTTYTPPSGPGIRVDTGIYEGAEISIFYDPMIAKLSAHAETRDAATKLMAEALDAFVISGPSHNIGFLAAVVARERFRSGRLTTHFIAEEFPDGLADIQLSAKEALQALAVAGAAQFILATCDAAIAGAMVPEDWVILYREASHPAKITRRNDAIAVELPTTPVTVKTSWQPGDATFRAATDSGEFVCQIERRGIGWHLRHGGAVLDIMVLPPPAAMALARMPAKPKAAVSRHLLSPMPGLLVSIAVGAGQEVKAGEELAVIEAMKMENVLRAERDGTVTKLCAKPGDSLAVDQVILEFA